MNLFDALLKDMPKAAFKLNTAGTAYEDITGHGNTLSGTPAFTSSLVNGNVKALLVNTASMVSTSTTVFKSGTEAQPFSIEAWVLPTTFTGNVSILSHDSIFDGLSFDGNNIIFRVDYNTLPNAEVLWPVPDFPEAIHVVSTYSREKIQLYVNEILQSELELTDAHLRDGFRSIANPSTLYCGQSISGNERIAVDGIVIFNKVLDQTMISNHFLAGRNVPTVPNIVGQNSGGYFDGIRRDIALQQTWSTTNDWQAGVYSDVSIASGPLKPLFDPTTNLSLPGVWKGSLGLGSIPLTVIQGVKLSWNGDGVFTVATSLDGTTYTPRTNGELVPSTQGINPTGRVLDIRVTFAGGATLDIAEVRDFMATVYATNKVHGSDASREVTLIGAVSTALETNEPIERNSAAGINFYGGYAMLGVDTTNDPRSIAALEFWVKPSAMASNFYIAEMRSGYAGYIHHLVPGALTYDGHSAVYINGTNTASGIGHLSVGEWTHIMYVPLSPISTSIILSNISESFQGQMALVATYPIAPTAAQALATYNSYSQQPSVQSVDPAGIALAELPNAYSNYVLNWSAETPSV